MQKCYRSHLLGEAVQQPLIRWVGGSTSYIGWPWLGDVPGHRWGQTFRREGTIQMEEKILTFKKGCMDMAYVREVSPPPK